jgi:hypothetical protein
LVFFLTFVTIGSLRFRVPQRSRQAAVSLVHRKRGEPFRIALKKQKNLIMNDNTRSSNFVAGGELDLSAETPKSAIQYILVDELTTTESSLVYRKFKAILVNHKDDGKNDMIEQQGLTVKEWASTVATASEGDSSIVLLNDIIASSPYDAVFFETPSTTAATYESQLFEFVLVDAPRLLAFAESQSSTMSANPFHNALATASNATAFAATFLNLGADALLVVPKATGGSAERQESHQYAHLATFIRNGASEQIAAVWNMVAQAYLDRVLQQQPNPVWLSTSGMGVLWLHFRLDTVPKYYTYEPYRKF